MPQRLVAVVGGGALAPCRRHVLPQAAGGCQVLAPPLVVPAVTGATLPQAAVLESIAAGWCVGVLLDLQLAAGWEVGSDCRQGKKKIILQFASLLSESLKTKVFGP